MLNLLKSLPDNLLEYSNSGKLIVLDNPDVIYILKEGDFNIFLTEFDEKNHATNRIFYTCLSDFSCKAIRGIAPHSISKLKLCAVANLNTSYIELPYKYFDKLSEVDKELISEQLDKFIYNLIKTSVPNVEIDTSNLIKFFTDNNRELYDFFDNFIINKKIGFNNQYKLLKAESNTSHNKAISNLFRFFNTQSKYNFDENQNTLIGAVSALGKIQGIKFDVSSFDEKFEDHINIDAISKQSSIRKRQITLELNWQYKCGIPFLAKLKTGESVAVFSFEDNDNAWHWYNSATAELKAVDDEFIENIVNKGVIFYKPFPNKPITLKTLLSLMWEMSCFDINRALLLFFIVSLLSATIPIINSVVFSTVIPLADYQLLIQIFVLATGFALAKGVIDYLSSLLLLRIRTRLNFALQASVWDRLLNMPLSFFKDYSIGDMTNRSLGVMQLSNIFSNTFLKNFLTSTFTFPALIVMFYYSPTFSVIMIFFLFIMSICFFICAFISYKLQKEMTNIVGEIQGDIVQYFAGINKIRATGTENQTLAHWSEKFSVQKKIYFSLSNYNKITVILSTALPVFTITILIAITTFIFHNSPEEMIKLSDFVAFSSALSIVTAALSVMFNSLIEAVEAIPVYQRLSPLLENLPESNIWQNQVNNIEGNIEVKHVTFKYNSLHRTILNDINLQISAGEFVAIVGESGSGKSTLLRLLLGFEKPLQGSISYDSFDLNQVNLRQLRSQLGVVLQDSKLIPDTIYKNIVAGSVSLNIDDAWEAARLAGCADDIEAMPMQMHTMISGVDGNISGGQRQRILIARALVKKPKILFFDEATSALDNNAQNIVRETIANLDVTKIVIAHRLSTVVDADRIVVLNEGSIVEQGTYDELIKLGGFFSKLAKRQLVDNI